ncbi:MAG TPA: 16S rRNA (cytosine(1402)-N(4))-methyltransferase RsmH [Anaerolineales bacterium]|nr:16S rRNA (cytosine(1402)-N(4))-methyltransferase RsmH [Anaerolineales bacterium]
MSEADPHQNATRPYAAANHGHVPVLYSEILTCLEPRPGGRYLDGTLGAGGHAQGLLEASSPDGLLLALDRDGEAVHRAGQRLASFGARAVLRQASFRAVNEILAALGWQGVDGAVLDLGLSSPQLAEAERGFSFVADGALDMRFDRAGQAETAEDLVNHLVEHELVQLLWEFGEERNSRSIARAIVRARPIRSTRELAEIVAAASRRTPAAGHSRIHPATRTFQALRIAVNDELGELKAGLPEVVRALNVGGRVAVISFHSLEDRIVKQTLRGLAGRAVSTTVPWPAQVPAPAVLRDLTPKPIRPSRGEAAANPRARSARLRVAERVSVAGEGVSPIRGARTGA